MYKNLDRYDSSQRHYAKNVISTDLDETYLDLQIILKEKEISFLAIRENRQGVISEDIVRKNTAENITSLSISIAQIM